MSIEHTTDSFCVHRFLLARYFDDGLKERWLYIVTQMEVLIIQIALLRSCSCVFAFVAVFVFL